MLAMLVAVLVLTGGVELLMGRCLFGPDGRFVREWGGPGSSPGEFSTPAGISVSRDGRVYVVDIGNSRIEVFTTAGTFLAQWPTDFETPRSLAIDGSGNVWAADFEQNELQVFTAEGAVVRTLRLPDPQDGGIFGPYGVAVEPDGNLWVADRFGFRLVEIDPTGRILQSINSFGAPPTLISPAAAACAPDGDLYVTNQTGDANGDTILVYGDRCH